jgi:hypothetical protein
MSTGYKNGSNIRAVFHFSLFLADLLTPALIGGRFQPFAIYSQTDTRKNANQMKNYYETNAHAGTL